jgi:hypothetical protein
VLQVRAGFGRAALAKAGDYELVAALKEKYTALSGSCADPGKDAPPPDKK